VTFRTFGTSTTDVSYGPPSGDVAIDNAESSGTSTSATRADHVHAFPAAPTGSGATDSTPGNAEADGTATTAARTDHVHGREPWGTSAEIGTGVLGTAVGAGSTGAVADAGHTHTTSSFGDTAEIGTGVLGTAAGAGSTGAVADAGHTHTASPFASTVTTGTGWGYDSTPGTGTAAARDDHAHGTPANPTGLALGLTGATAACRLVGATTGGAPTSGSFDLGDVVVDQTGKFWICTTAGTPGTWTEVGGTSTLSTYLFIDTTGESLALTGNATALPGTSAASSTAPIRLHNLWQGATAGNTVTITGVSTGDTYYFGAVGVNSPGLDLIATEPLQAFTSDNTYTLYYSVATLTQVTP